MNMTFIRVSGVLAILAFAFLAFPKMTYADEPAGKKLFLDNKCNTCHSIESQDIKRTLASSKAPDLSTVGDTRDADWISQFLQKKVDLDGKKHSKGWTGKDEDLKTLSEWLASLKKAK